MIHFQNDIRFEIHRDYLYGRVVILAFNENGYFVAGADGEVALVKVDPGSEVKPFMSFRIGATAAMQSLADALATFGVMPKFTDNAKELTATRAHLADMQRMANRAFDVLLTKEAADVAAHSPEQARA